MPVKNPKELFVVMLSDVRQSAERKAERLSELSAIAENPQVADALEEKESVVGQTVAKLDQCFKLIGEKPLKGKGRVREVLIEETLKDAAEISSPIAKQLWVLSKGLQLIHLRTAEYIALIAAAEITGNQEVRTLLESCLADKMAAVDRVRHLIRTIVESKIRDRSVA